MTEGNEPNSLGMSEFDVRLREEIKERHEFVTELMKELENPLKGLELFKKKCTASNRKNNSSNTLRELHRQLQRLLIGTVSESTENVSTENVNKSPQRKTDDLKQPPQNDQESNQNGPCNIKQEKQSISSYNEENKENAIKIKSEPNNEMPPPPVPRTARRKTKKALKPEPSERTTRSRTRRIAKKTNSSEQTSSDEESDIRNSDVIVKPTNVSIIEITDDESPVKNGRRTKIAEQSLPRSSRARTAKNKKDLAQESTKRSRSLEEKSDTDDQKNNKSAKKSKYQKDNQQAEPEKVEETVTENAEETQQIETDVSPPKRDVLNETVAVQNPTYVTNEIMKLNGNFNVQDIMTSDESESEKLPDKNTKTKAVFNPYVRSPLKKKIEAFEKLGASAEPARYRTKIQTKDDNSNSKIPSTKQVGSATVNRFIPTSQSTTKKNRILPVSSTSISQSKTPSTTTKISQNEYREREMRRREKEAEALQKKEAMLQAAAEEKKRIREERQQKAQLNREIKEKDKQKQLEDAERAKELKMKQILAEREEKLAKQRAEADRKRMLAKMKAQEEKRKEQNRALDGKTKKALPIYMTEKTPLLPTTDCYDSDNENETESDDHKKYLPDWARKDALLKMDRQILAISHQIKNAFFCVEPKTLDLTEIFPSIEPRKLTRNSSAVWTKPPRYTQFMSPLQESDADDSN